VRVAVSLYFSFSAYHNLLVILGHYSGQSRQTPQQGGVGAGRRPASPMIDDHIDPIADLERGRVAGVKLEMEDDHVGNKVQIIDDQLDHINRSSSLQLCSTFLGSDLLQETTLEIDFYDGFRHQIHPPTIRSHAMLITTVQLNGFFRAVYTINGNLLAPSCGYAENVRYS
jgi:hypothetical protein